MAYETIPIELGSFSSPYIYIYTWNPNDPCFDWKFGLVLEGLFPSKIEVIKGFQVYNRRNSSATYVEYTDPGNNCSAVSAWRQIHRRSLIWKTLDEQHPTKKKNSKCILQHGINLFTEKKALVSAHCFGRFLFFFHIFRDFSRDPQECEPLLISFPYHSHTSRDSYRSGMGVV